MSTTTKTSARVMETDPKTGRKYVKTQTVEGAAVTVTKFSGEEVGGSYRWTSATYDVIAPGGEVFASSIKWDGKTFKVGTKPAPSLGKAVRAVLGIEPLADPKPKTTTKKAPADKAPEPASGGTTRKGSTRKSAATRKAEQAEKDRLAAASGSSVIETDPDTGLPRIKPEVAAKADAIAAAQKARNAQASR